MRLKKSVLLFAPFLLIAVSACGTDDYFGPQLESSDEEVESFDPEGLPDVEIHRDGTVEVGSRRFSSVEEFHQSEEFQVEGRRCGTVHNFSAATMQLSGGDCSFNFTSIKPEYNPDTLVEIPVVFHIIQRTNGTGHIPEHLIHSQMEILNEDFNALQGTPGGPGNDARIRFVLANEDPQGNPTTGIYYHTNNQWFSDPGSGVTPMKANLNWDPDRYLNIYTNNAAGALGYATFPQLSAGNADDGVVLAWNTVGRNAPQGGMFNQGRTATHEVGHYLGLFHTFEGGCGSSNNPYGTGDRIADTVAHTGPDHQCQQRPSPCGGGNTPIRNYMNYSPDTCMHEFTPEQINRMRCSLIHFRPDLFRVVGGNGSGPVETSPEADFGGSAQGLTVQFSDESAPGSAAITSWQWSFGDGQSSSSQNPTHTYSSTGTYNVTVVVTDANGNTDSTVKQLSVTAPASDSGPQALTSGDWVSGLSGATGGELHYYIDVPSGAGSLDVAIQGGTGDADLYVRRGSQPTESQWDCRPYQAGNDEVCSFDEPQSGRWYVMVRGYQAFQGVELVAQVTGTQTGPADSSGAPSSDPEPEVAEATGLSAGDDEQLRFTIDLPSGVEQVTFETTGGTGDVDLYLRQGAPPTLSEFDYRPFLYGNEETVTVDQPASGEWHIMLHAYEAFSGVTLRVTYY